MAKEAAKAQASKQYEVSGPVVEAENAPPAPFKPVERSPEETAAAEKYLRERTEAVAVITAAPPKPPRFRVSVPGTHVADGVVEAADAAAAIEAFKRERGIVSFGAGPVVERIQE